MWRSVTHAALHQCRSFLCGSISSSLLKPFIAVIDISRYACDDGRPARRRPPGLQCGIQSDVERVPFQVFEQARRQKFACASIGLHEPPRRTSCDMQYRVEIWPTSSIGRLRFCWPTRRRQSTQHASTGPAVAGPCLLIKSEHRPDNARRTARREPRRDIFRQR